MPGPAHAGPGGPPRSALHGAVLAAMDTVLDPELDEPVTTLGFVERCDVDDEGVAVVRLRLPTFFCAPNFSFLMVADAYEAVTAVPGVTRADVALLDHHASDEINGGVSAGMGFVQTFEGEALEELDELRVTFWRKAVVAGQDRIARPLVDAGATPSDLAAMRLRDVPPSADLDRLRARRRLLGQPADDDAPLLLTADGAPLPVEQVPLHLRRARLTRVGIETNGEYCRQLYAVRYGENGPPA